MFEVNFDKSVQYLYSLGNEVEAMKLGLENIRTLLAALGAPQNNYLKVQVAGTNGKGSVCSFLNSICVRAGIKVGLYTSPHLVSVRERVKIEGIDISEEAFARYASRVRETAETLVTIGELETVPTFFEQVTTTALIAFAEEKVELAILETGLGGRFDATTDASAEIAAITAIDFDHQQYLGETLAEIAAEKAAIIRPDSKVVVAAQNEDAMRVIMAVCGDFGVSPNLADGMTVVPTGGNTTGRECVKIAREWDFSKEETPSLRVGFLPVSPIAFETAQDLYENVRLGLLGRHQIENAKVAILLAEILQEHFNITTENIIAGLQYARHPGRLEFIGNFLFDGAHNVGGAKALREFLDEFVDRPVTMIFGSMRDKNVRKIADLLFLKAESLILTRPDNSRALTPAELAGFVPTEFDPGRVHLTKTVDEALMMAQRLSNGGLILVSGSLYLIGEVQKILKTRSQI